MEHPCYKCGASVEDGTPFCTRCSAPQIRVAGPEPLAPAGATPEVAVEQYTSHAPPQTSALEWPQALPSAGIALLAAIFLIFLGMPAGLGMLAAGFLSVVLYRRRCPAVHLTAGMGARLGALTGGLGFAALAETDSRPILLILDSPETLPAATRRSAGTCIGAIGNGRRGLELRPIEYRSNHPRP